MWSTRISTDAAPKVFGPSTPTEMSSPVRYYTGIGSRETPPEALQTMARCARWLAEHGLVLRSGGAPGADTAFESGVDQADAKVIYVPWDGFQGHPLVFKVPQAAEASVDLFHPAPKSLSRGARGLMARNAMQILGHEMDTPSLFVLCWTPDGCESHATRTRATGGTGQAISIASHHQVPVFNLRSPNWRDRFLAAGKEQGWF